MNNILDFLFIKIYQEQEINYIYKKVRERDPEIKVMEIQQYLKNQKVNQINTTVNKHIYTR